MKNIIVFIALLAHGYFYANAQVTNTGLSIGISTNTIVTVFDFNTTGDLVNAGTLRSSGDVTMSGAYSGAGSVILMGTNQNLNATDKSITNLILQGGGIKTLESSLNVETLDLTNGKLDVNSQSLSVSGSIANATSSNYIIGKLTLEGNGDLFFPIGTASVYAPVTLKSVSGTPKVSIELKEENPNGLAGEGILKTSTKRYWEVTNESGYSGAVMEIPAIDEDAAEVFSDVVVAYAPLENTYLGSGAISRSGDLASGLVTSGDVVPAGKVTLAKFFDEQLQDNDIAALTSIYDATDGDMWINNSGWKSQNLAVWAGVTVVDKRVTSVDIATNNLTGAFPTITTGLEELTNLDLSENNLNSVGDLNALSKLTSLNLVNNQLGFASLETNLEISGLTYSPQDSVLKKDSRFFEQGQVYTLDRTVTGSANTYKWFKKDNAGTVTSVAGSTSTIVLDFTGSSEEGSYYAEVTNSTVPDLTLITHPIRVKVSSLESDRLILIELFNATKGSQWINNSGWNTDTVSNGWFGVTVTDNRVTELSLPANGLNGNAPASFVDLGSVKTIDLSKNDLRSFPDVSTLPLTALNVSANRLVFRDLLPNKDVPGLIYTDQKRFGQTVNDTIDAGTNYLLSIEDLGAGSQYQWRFGKLKPGQFFNNEVDTVVGATSRMYTLENIDINSQGTYRVSVTNPALPNLTIESRNRNIMAQTDFSGTVNFNESVVNDAEVFVWRQTPEGSFVKEDSTKTNSAGDYELKDIVLGSFVVVAKPDREKEVYKNTLQTYYTSQLTYNKADTLLLDAMKEKVDIDLLSYTPVPVTKGAQISGTLSQEYIEEDEDEESRTQARRKVRKAACSMRKFKSTGRSEQSEDELEDEIAYYIETDDEGYFNFTGVAEGRYSLNIEFPGVPMDPDAEVEFVIGGDKENQKFTVDAVVEQSGITVKQNEVLYSLKPYIKDITLYPNPTEGLLQFDYTVYRRLNDLKVQLINTQGVLLEEHAAAYRKATYKAALDLTPYSTGVYVIVFTDEAGTFAQHIKVSRK